ncbi:MAG: recombinase family protein [Nanoarchaeota archaeon]|nr:recombinase family protein [Nanoarchaeota archaeon]
MKCPHCGEYIEIERKFENRGEIQKKGMINKASSGKVMSRAAFGYKIIDNRLEKDEENARKVQEIFSDFLKNEISLNKLAKKYSFSVNGIKKMLKNYTYIGKIKFNGEMHQGQHEPIVSSTDFNHVQDKLDKILRRN